MISARTCWGTGRAREGRGLTEGKRAEDTSDASVAGAHVAAEAGAAPNPLRRHRHQYCLLPAGCGWPTCFSRGVPEDGSSGGDGRVHAQGRPMSRIRSVACKNGPPSLELAQFGFQAGLLHRHPCRGLKPEMVHEASDGQAQRRSTDDSPRPASEIIVPAGPVSRSTACSKLDSSLKKDLVEEGC
jgi:hypothetical protein